MEVRNKQTISMLKALDKNDYLSKDDISKLKFWGQNENMDFNIINTSISKGLITRIDRFKFHYSITVEGRDVLAKHLTITNDITKAQKSATRANCIAFISLIVAIIALLTR